MTRAGGAWSTSDKFFLKVSEETIVFSSRSCLAMVHLEYVKGPSHSSDEKKVRKGLTVRRGEDGFGNFFSQLNTGLIKCINI